MDEYGWMREFKVTFALVRLQRQAGARVMGMDGWMREFNATFAYKVRPNKQAGTTVMR